MDTYFRDSGCKLLGQNVKKEISHNTNLVFALVSYENMPQCMGYLTRSRIMLQQWQADIGRSHLFINESKLGQNIDSSKCISDWFLTVMQTRLLLFSTRACQTNGDLLLQSHRPKYHLSMFIFVLIFMTSLKYSTSTMS